MYDIEENSSSNIDSLAQTVSKQQVKRLGWSRLKLEPDYLVDRVVDALKQIGASFAEEEAHGGANALSHLNRGSAVLFLCAFNSRPSPS